MWYIYEKNGLWVNTQKQPEIEFIQIERMPPMPVQEGFEAVLKADIETESVWYELVDIRTSEQKNEEIRRQREAAYAAESDNLYMACQKYTAQGQTTQAEESHAAWLARVAEIDRRLPYE